MGSRRATSRLADDHGPADGRERVDRAAACRRGGTRTVPCPGYFITKAVACTLTEYTARRTGKGSTWSAGVQAIMLDLLGSPGGHAQSTVSQRPCDADGLSGGPPECAHPRCTYMPLRRSAT
eukprot:6202142-Prymnesium_polylepis.1